MNRESGIVKLKTLNDPWDVLVVGGGAIGHGTALDAASRGYKTLLLEQKDMLLNKDVKRSKSPRVKGRIFENSMIIMDNGLIKQ